MRIGDKLPSNLLIEWTANGMQRHRHSSDRCTPLASTHRQRSAS